MDINTQLSRVQKNKKAKKKLVLRVFLITLAILVLGVSSFAGYAYFKVNSFFNNANDGSVVVNDPDGNDNKPIEEEKSITDEPFAILLLGEDYRPETNSENTDAIIVSVWDPEKNKVTLLSIPRDTKVNIPGYGEGKINSVYVRGEIEKLKQERKGQTPTTSGPLMTMQVISDLLDIPIKKYAKVDFKGFELAIDELGGIQVDVEREMHYHSKADGTSIDIRKGLQILNGKRALDYARFRKSDDGNHSTDFERNQRHQKILMAFVNELVSFNGISNIFDIIDIAGDHIKTNITSQDMKDIFWKFKSIKKDNIKTVKMDSYWKTPYVYVDDKEIDRVQIELKKAYGLIEETPAPVNGNPTDGNNNVLK